MEKITVAYMRDLEKQVSAGDISYSRMIELLNERTGVSSKLKNNHNIPMGFQIDVVEHPVLQKGIGKLYLSTEDYKMYADKNKVNP